ncbi:MAG: glycine cleavage system aminomethyltransferase GcvT [Gemmatimonadota bacterium]|nr:glycine cleavage system aminomethyltransferase GcvT [Gemmatimonadota bacterium]MDE2954760.1 glycine cleavage system aminomethyltransferase GcvT [Gemmatimonadota bacterium]
MENLKKTPLNEIHHKTNARMVPFGGWEMPVQYAGIVAEHQAVRSHAGLFDVSHMGEFEFKGKGAKKLVQFLTANDIDRIGIGRGQYSLFLNKNGGAIDDIIVYRLGKTTYLVVVNAANVDKDWKHVQAVAKSFDNVQVANRSEEFALLALQGPKAEAVLSPTANRNLSEIGFFRIRKAELAGIPVHIARTGYTGEGMNGFEIFTRTEDAAAIWNALIASPDVSPAGLGARDTLRIEASLPLYGQELNEATTPLEAGLDMFVSQAGGFSGADALERQRADGLTKTLVMIEMIDRGIPRLGYKILDGSGNSIGEVTSGTTAPYLKKNIAMGYVPPDHSEIGTELAIAIRNRALKARVVPRPFFKR